MTMRCLQMVRAKRRTGTIPSANELSQSIIDSSNLQVSPRRQASMLGFGNISRQSSIQCDDYEDSVVTKRQTLNVQSPTAINDTPEIPRRPSFNNGRRLSIQSQEITEATKSKTNIKNFYVFFVLLFLVIFLAVIYSFIRMIKNQSS